VRLSFVLPLLLLLYVIVLQKTSARAALAFFWGTPPTSPSLHPNQTQQPHNHTTNPTKVHFWAPTFKWGITFANIADLQRPPEKLSYPQQIGAQRRGGVVCIARAAFFLGGGGGVH
jgi:hypothetical protein